MLRSISDKPQTGEPSLDPLHRALAGLRRGDLVLLTAGNEQVAVMGAAETLRDVLFDLGRQAGRGHLYLVLTEHRAAALKLVSNVAKAQPAAAVALPVDGLSLDTLRELADPLLTPDPPPPMPDWQAIPADIAGAAISLAKQAHLLPAAVVVLLADLDGEDRAKLLEDRNIVAARIEEVTAYRRLLAGALKRVAEARVPLAGAQDARVIAFRPEDGGIEHLAIVVGQLDPSAPVLVRLHSQCFTGDLLGSLRCDCGDQLHGAIRAIGEAGSGVLLYLSQEGRGIGLVNKLRAYALQDRGADTAEANEILGFEADERLYFSAAAMLHQLQVAEIRLMTNNPRKVDAMARCGLRVVERVAHSFPANGHNEIYLATKAQRMGHLF